MDVDLQQLRGFYAMYFHQKDRLFLIVLIRVNDTKLAIWTQIFLHFSAIDVYNPAKVLVFRLCGG